MRAAKPLAFLALTGIGSALVVGFQVPEAASVAKPAATANSTTTSASTGGSTSTSSGSSGAATASPTTAGTSGTAMAATYADGTYAGSAVDEPWGTFQVQAVISGGHLTDVVIVSAPPDDHSSRINSQAVPALTQAAIASQSADIDLISGATWTSQSYTSSLQAALDAARAAAETAS